MIMMFSYIQLEKGDDLQVNLDGASGKRFKIKLGEITLFIERQDLEELEDMIEEALWDETEHRDYLKEQVDKLESECDDLRSEKPSNPYSHYVDDRLYHRD